jgi:hypothetical protein
LINSRKAPSAWRCGRMMSYTDTIDGSRQPGSGTHALVATLPEECGRTKIWMRKFERNLPDALMGSFGSVLHLKR